jgi:hypothetical protein
MNTDFLMGIGVGIMLVAISIGYALCYAIEVWKQRRRQKKRANVLPMRKRMVGTRPWRA